MFQVVVIAAPPEPSAFCGVYAYENWPKFSVTTSVWRSSLAAVASETEEISTFCNVMTMYTSGVAPALRSVSVAFVNGVPSQHFCNSTGLAVSTNFVNDRSCTFTLPAPLPLPVWVVPDWVRPQLQESTSIAPLNLESADSPLTFSICMKISTAMTRSPS